MVPLPYGYRRLHPGVSAGCAHTDKVPSLPHPSLLIYLPSLPSFPSSAPSPCFPSTLSSVVFGWGRGREPAITGSTGRESGRMDLHCRGGILTVLIKGESWSPLDFSRRIPRMSLYPVWGGAVEASSPRHLVWTKAEKPAGIASGLNWSHRVLLAKWATSQAEGVGLFSLPIIVILYNFIYSYVQKKEILSNTYGRRKHIFLS